jgi:sec-independent protein translocase protein TatC
MFVSQQSLKGHLSELRFRLLLSFIVFLANIILVYSFSHELLAMLLSPLIQNSREIDLNYNLIYTGLTEPFLVYIKLSIYFGFYLSLPILAFQLYKFLAPGLKPREKTVFIAFLTSGHVLLYLAIIFVYLQVLPGSIGFFLNIASEESFKFYAKIGEYIDLSLVFINCFAAAFQLPVIMAICVLLNIVELQTFKNARRIAIVAIFTLAAIITPPDIFSQIILALPLILLYEISLYCCQFLQKKENENA